MKLHEKLLAGGIITACLGIAFHILWEMFATTKNKFGMSVLIIGMCVAGAGKIIGEAQR